MEFRRPGRLVYTPEPGFVGTATFTYTIDDGQSGTATASVRIVVAAAPAVPAAPRGSGLARTGTEIGLATGLAALLLGGGLLLVMAARRRRA